MEWDGWVYELDIANGVILINSLKAAPLAIVPTSETCNEFGPNLSCKLGRARVVAGSRRKNQYRNAKFDIVAKRSRRHAK